ncbi:hypothetical protein JWJ90_13625 [Desulfobulbus rhabdoformis]|nr:hypothetical protein [Desulfobulbus rhabdoformis]
MFKVKLEPAGFFVAIGETRILFRKESEWEGMVKLVSVEYGTMLVDRAGDLVDNLFNIGTLGTSREYVVVKASPAIIELIRKAQG